MFPIKFFQWQWTRICYFRHGIELNGRPNELVWYFAFGANMHDSAFIERRRMKPLAWKVGRLRGYRLRFNLDGRPRGKGAPANITLDPRSEVWGVLYQLSRTDLVQLDGTEGVPGKRYRHLWIETEDNEGVSTPAVAYIADGNDEDGNPSLRYLTLLREGGREHGLPEPYLEFLSRVVPAE